MSWDTQADLVISDEILRENTAVNFADGVLPPHWDHLTRYLNSLGSRELSLRWKKARQIIHEHSSAYNVFNRQTATDRAWALDPVPLPISSRSWQTLENGIHQRSKLLALIYRDLYGERNLINKGVLPPELIFANPGFLRECQAGRKGAYPDLHLFSSDLVRLPDGRWQVISHGSQSPTGAGYALENRIILSSILPRMFHSGKVQRLAPFFKHLTLALMEISGQRKQEPIIVMLSEGPSCPTYFEHVFLARYLGHPLVETSDLTVRNESVYLKTLGGLQRVDVILRQIADHQCDPQLISSPSLPGIPGLAQAVRSGNVSISNPLGSGLLESPGLLSFLPELSRFLLGEDLILATTDTLWCGRDESLNQVLTQIEENRRPLILFSAFSPAHAPAVRTDELNPDGRTRLINTVKKTAYAWSARFPDTPFSLPVWSEKEVVNRYAAIRMFSTAIAENKAFDGPDDDLNPLVETAVMPGGLTRVSRDPSAFWMPDALGKGQGGKDTWCLSDRPAEFKSMLHRFSTPYEIHRGSDLPSRVADNMLWLGRYMERIEGTLRVIRSVLVRVASDIPLNQIVEMPFLLRSMVNLEIIGPDLTDPRAAFSLKTLDQELHQSAFSDQCRKSIRENLNNVSIVAGRVSDRLSNDSWQILGRIEKGISGISTKDQTGEILERLNSIILDISAFSGLSLESMTRGMGWRFMDMGRRIERATHITQMFQGLIRDSQIPGSQDLEALLEVSDSTITYHTRYRTTLHLEPVVDLLLLDELNPRAAGFQLAAILSHVETLPRQKPRPFRTREEKTALDLTTRLRLADTGELVSTEDGNGLSRLKQLLDSLQTGLQDIADTITQHYLSRIETEKQLKAQTPDTGGAYPGEALDNEV